MKQKSDQRINFNYRCESVAAKVPLMESMQPEDQVRRSNRFFKNQIRKRFHGLVGGEVEVHDQLTSYLLPGNVPPDHVWRHDRSRRIVHASAVVNR